MCFVMFQYLVLLILTWACNQCSRTPKHGAKSLIRPPSPEKRSIAGKPSLPEKDGVRTKRSSNNTASTQQTTGTSLAASTIPLPSTIQGSGQQQVAGKPENFIPYPDVKEPSPSVKKRRADELARDKLAKIASGFYQPKSDQDDTLEQVGSLQREESERNRTVKSHRNALKASKAGSVTTDMKASMLAKMATGPTGAKPTEEKPKQ